MIILSYMIDCLIKVLCGQLVYIRTVYALINGEGANLAATASSLLSHNTHCISSNRRLSLITSSRRPSRLLDAHCSLYPAIRSHLDVCIASTTMQNTPGMCFFALNCFMTGILILAARLQQWRADM
jgi:hypothetical protein